MGYKGQRKHLKRTNAPKSYGLRKLGGTFAIKAKAGPHSKNSSIPLSYILRHKLHFAETTTEVRRIMKKRMIKINGKVRTDERFPIGVNDIMQTVDKFFQVTYDSNGRFSLISISEKQARFKALRVVKKYTSVNKVPMIQTNDGGHFRFAHPKIKLHDTITYDLVENKITEILPFQLGMTVFAIDGNNSGRIGTLEHIDPIPGRSSVVTVTDKNSNSFVTLIDNIMVIGDESGPKFKTHKSEGLRLSHLESRNKLIASKGDIVENLVNTAVAAAE